MTIAPETVIAHLHALEDERCRCIVEQRFDRLAELLSSRLIHTHTRGNADDRTSYLSFVAGVIESLSLHREDLKVILMGDRAAVMHGRQVNVARRRGHDEQVRVESVVLQVWACEDDGVWRQVAFQATPLGAPPPAVSR